MSDASSLSSLCGDGVSPRLVSVLSAIADACRRIARDLRTDAAEATPSRNAFGDAVLSADVMAEAHVARALSAAPFVSATASEEAPDVRAASGRAEDFFVAYDPLDGSGVAALNFAVGSLFAVWRGAAPGSARGMAAAAAAVYGPRALLLVGVPGGARGPFVAVFALDGGKWRRGADAVRLAPRATVFAPGNLRAASRLPFYRRLLEAYVRRGATLRYTGAMVPDVCQILLRGDGVFFTPRSAAHAVKLRLLFEAAPMAFLVHCAGGRATTGETDLLDVRITDTRQRTPIALGSSEDVAEYERLCREESKL